MKRITSVFLVFAMLLTLTPMNIFAADDAVFSDVRDTDYYAQAATALEKLGILDGYPDGTFGAERSITRAEMAAVVCRMIDKETDGDKAAGKTAFDDVAASHWASGYINVASDEKIIEGDGNGKFRPEDDVKYEEAIKMIVCALGYGDNIEVDPKDWSAGYLEAADEKGVSDDLKGSKGKAATRGDVAVMTYNGLASDSAYSKIPAAPVASVAAGEYTGTKKVSLSTKTKDAEIYYTTDGTTPTVKSTKYTKEISITKTSTLKAIAVKNGVVSKSVMSVDYTIKKVSSGGGGGGSSSSTTKYTVSFDLNYEGATGAPASQKISKGGYIIQPAEPVRDLYIFAGWYEEPSCTTEYDFNEAVTSDKILYAGWYSTLYGIHSLSLDELNNVQLNVSTDSVCEARITFYNEDKTTVLGTTTTNVGSELEMADITIDISGITLPQYFIMTADLFDEEDSQLCKTYTCIDYTKEYEEFMSKTVDDFIDRTVVNFDESEEMNFAVLNDEVDEIHISENTNNLNEESSKLTENYYVIDNIDESLRDIHVGDELYLDYDNGCLITVGSYNIDDNTITIQGSTDYDLKDYFDYIKVDMILDPNTYEEEVLPGYTEDEEQIDLMAEIVDVDANISSLKVAIPIELSIENQAKTRKGKFAGSVSAEIKPHLVIKWDAHLFSEDYFEFSVSLEVKTGIDVSLEYSRTNGQTETEIGYDEMLKKVAEIPMGKVLIPFGVTGLGASVELTVPISVEFKCSANFSTTTTTKVGFSYDTRNGVDTFKEKSNSKSFTIEGELEIKVGPKLEESVEFLGGVVKASLEQSGGMYLDAKAELNIENTDHLCRFCVSGEFGGFLTVSAKLSYHVTDHISGTPVDYTLYDAKWKIIDCYFSSDIGFGFGECPNTAVEWNGHCNLSGKVTIADADMDNSNNQPLANATVSIDNNATNQKATTLTSSVGEYRIDNIPAGEYTITISKNGYISVTQQLTVVEEQENYYNAVIEAISEHDDGNGVASGKIYDAVTGAGVANLTLKIRKGINTLTGDVLCERTTSENGTYVTTELAAGNYTVQILDERTLNNEDERYYQSSFTIKILGNTTISNQDGAVTNGLTADQIRIVLRWGATPSDLDSHLVGPGTSGRFHTFYRNKTYYSGGVRYADLDLDDTSSYGPETTTIYKPISGEYTFYVHDFSNINESSSNALANSGAYVEVYLSNAQTAAMTFYVPNTDGTLWTVFRYDSDTGRIVPVNTMSYKKDPYSVGLSEVGNRDIFNMSNSDYEMLFKDIENSPKE
ncbi:MAG: S-layer homology domain-containing protein [Clostridiales bacterium]|nr:S-layer homology domain-containing protein [Clostridiales bacterium]